MRSFLLGILATLMMASVAHAVDVASCGQLVGPGETGTLTGDLDCSAAASESNAVVLGNGATLQLDGHTITAAPEGVGVSCDSARCKISGPGWILGAPPTSTPGVGIASDKNVVVDGSIEIYGHAVGIRADDGAATLSDLILRDNGEGVVAKVVRGSGVLVLKSERVGITAHKKIQGGPFEIRDSGWAGIETDKFKLDGLIATTNGFDGTASGAGIVATKRGVLRNSLVDANMFAGSPLDVLTGKQPVLIDTDCNKSAMLVSGAPSGTWGVCGLD